MKEYCNSCEQRDGAYCARPTFEERAILIGRKVVAGFAEGVIRTGALLSVQPVTSPEWPAFSAKTRELSNSRMAEVDVCIAVHHELIDNLLINEK